MRDNKPIAARLSTFLLGASLVLCGSGLLWTKYAHAKEDSKNPPVKVQVDNAPLQREGKAITSFAPVVKKVAPSVVNVFTTTKSKQAVMPHMDQLPDHPFFRRFFGEPDEENSRRYRTPRQSGLGSGVIVTKDGYILTNNHVVENADEIRIALKDGREFTAKVVGRDPKTDIAVLKVDAENLPYLELANSDNIEIGDLVLAVGNPFGLGQTVTMGMVSATGRGNMGIDYEDFIQTDAAINPGNSGGALVDAEGRLIGINTAIISRSGGNQGIGFAVPVNLAHYVMESLVEKGRVVRGFLGVLIQDVDPTLAKQFKLEDSEGALVAEVTEGSPAAKAGVQDGDVIVKFNNRDVRSSRQLKLTVAQTAPGSEVPLTIVRDGKPKVVTVKVKELPGSDVAGKDDKSGSTTERLAGVSVADVDAAMRRKYNLPEKVEGAVVVSVDPDSAAYTAGLRPGDVIREINRTKVDSAEALVEQTEKIKDPTILLRVWKEGHMRYLVVDESAQD